MLSHPVRVRSACHASAADPNQLRRNFVWLPRFAAENEKPAGTAGLRQTLPLLVSLPMCPGRTIENLERAKGFEPSTPTLARSCSTPELHPHPRDWRRATAGNGQSYAKCSPRMQQPREAEKTGRMARYRQRFAEIGPKRANLPLLRPPVGVPRANWRAWRVAIRAIFRTRPAESRSVHRGERDHNRMSPTIRRRPDPHRQWA